MDNDQIIACVRAFNRFYTRQIGVLEEHMVQSPFSLAEGRVLYEIRARGHTTARDLSQALGLDPAYVSRILQRFLQRDMVALSPIPGDRRQNSIALTPDGDAAYDGLDKASDAAVAALLKPLDDGRRRELVSAMATIQRILGEPTGESAVVLRPHQIGEIGWLIHRQGVLYNWQFGWNGEFEALIARLYYEYESAPPDPPRMLWIAERAGQPVGSIFVMPSEGRPGTAQLRMLYVEPEARGLGLGTTLVNQVIRFSRENGYRRVRLWTQSVLTSARAIYAAAGFRKVEEEAHRSFGKDLVGEHWELEL